MTVKLSLSVLLFILFAPPLFAGAGLGDLNFDNKINQADIPIMTYIIAGAGYMWIADLNQDGRVDGKDLLILCNKVQELSRANYWPGGKGVPLFPANRKRGA